MSYKICTLSSRSRKIDGTLAENYEPGELFWNLIQKIGSQGSSRGATGSCCRGATVLRKPEGNRVQSCRLRNPKLSWWVREYAQPSFTMIVLAMFRKRHCSTGELKANLFGELVNIWNSQNMDGNCQRAKIVGIRQSPSWRTVQYLTTFLEELQYKMSAVWSYQLLFPRLRVRLPKELIASWCCPALFRVSHQTEMIKVTFAVLLVGALLVNPTHSSLFERAKVAAGKQSSS